VTRRTNTMPQPNPAGGSVLSPGWVGYGTNSVVSVVGGVFRVTKTVAASNNVGMNLGNSGASAHLGFPSQPAGTTVTLYCQARLGTANTVAKGIQLIARDDPNNDSTLAAPVNTLAGSNQYSNQPLDGVWRDYFVTFVVPAARTLTRVYVVGSGANAAVGDLAEFRNILVEVGPLAAYFDGSTSDSRWACAWTGTAFNSTSTRDPSMVHKGPVTPTRYYLGSTAGARLYLGATQLTP
jgi:hypothetical protein